MPRTRQFGRRNGLVLVLALFFGCPGVAAWWLSSLATALAPLGRSTHELPFAAWVPTAWAQEQTGVVRGRLVDADGNPLGGLEVTLDGTAGRLVTTTQGDGTFVFPRLLPGTFELRATLPTEATQAATGASTSTREIPLARGRIGVGQTLAFTLVADPRAAIGSAAPADGSAPAGGQQRATSGDLVVAMSDELTVTSASARVREELGTGTSVLLSAGELAALPHGRDLQDLAALAPNATTSRLAGGLSIAGASGAENRFLLDGVDTTHPQNGLAAKPVAAELVAEVEVRSAGYRAEFGGATGGVINALTRSGSESWQLTVGGFVGDAAWNGDPRPVVTVSPNFDGISYVTYDADEQTVYEPLASLGGPLWPGHAWFFLGYQGFDRETDRTVDFLTGTRRTFTQTQESATASATASGNLFGRLLWRLGGVLSPNEVARSLPEPQGSGSEDPADYRFGNEDDNASYRLRGDWIASSRWLFATQLARFDFDTATTNAEIVPFVTSFGGNPAVFPGFPSELLRPPGFTSGPRYNVIHTDRYQRDTLGLDGAGIFTAAGEHQTKVGVQAERLRNDIRRAGNATHHFWGWDRTDPFFGRRGTYGYLQVENPGTYGAVESENVALFAQDTWRPWANLVVDLGLRAERERVPDFRVGREGESAFAFGFDDKLAPRLGFAWDVAGDGRWTVRGNWGTYYDVTKYQMPRGSFGADRRVLYFYGIEQFDWTRVTCEVTDNDPANPPDCGGLPLLGVVNLRSSANDAIDPDIRPTESTQWQLGAVRALGRWGSLGLTFTRNELLRVIEDIGAFDPDLGAEIYAIGNPGEGASTFSLPGLRMPRPRRVYQALDLTLTRPLADRWQLRAAYTWSRLEGNFPGLASSDEGGRAAPNFLRAYDAWHNLFDQRGQPVDGRLATDRPHQLRLLASWNHPSGITVGLNQYAGSGTPRTTYVSRQGVYFFPYGRGDQGRTPTLTQTDLRLAWARHLGPLELELSATALNLFDEDTPTEYGQNLLRDDITLTDAQFRAGFDVEQLIAERGLRRDPRYQQVVRRQEGRVVRVGVMVRW
jgi:hypothetical protein